MKSLFKSTSFPVFFFLISLTFCFNSCKQNTAEQASSSTELSQPGDTLRRKEVQDLVTDINSKLPQDSYYKISYPLQSPADTLEFWMEDSIPSRISLKMYPPDMMVWPTYFVKNNELILVRMRTWSKKPPTPWAKESMIYLNEGKIFYCEERRMDLLGGDIPASIRDKPFSISTRTFSEIESDYKEFWPKVKEEIAKQAASSKGEKLK